MDYRDGDPRFSLIRPGERTPAAYTGPAQGHDFAWVKPSWVERWRGRQANKSLAVLNDGLRASTEYYDQTAAYELSRQAVTHARNQGELLPLKLEEERATRQLVIARTHGAIADELERRERAHREHKKALIELKGGNKAARARNKQAKRARRAARRAAERPHVMPEPASAPAEEGPEAFRRHLRTVEEAQANVSEGERRIRAIYTTAATERRQLTEDEMLKVDALNDAARAAEDEVRRSSASDFRP